MLTFMNKDGSVLEKISLSSLGKKDYALDATYALKIGDLLLITTSQHYLLVYDEKLNKRWILGNGWTGKVKLLYVKPFETVIILGKNFMMFVDLRNRKLMKYIQKLSYTVVDGFVCSGKLYVVGKSEEGYKVHVYSLGIGVVLP